MRLLALARPLLLAGMALCQVVLLVPSSAAANSYTVSTCDAGWLPDVQRAPGEDGPGAVDLCATPSGRALYASSYASSDRLAVGDYAGWRFDAPPDTTISRLVVDWSGRGDLAAGDWGPIQARIDASTTAGDGRIEAFSTTDTRGFTDAKWVRVSLACLPSPATSCRARYGSPISDVSHLWLKASTVTVLDRFARLCNPSAAPQAPTARGPRPSR